MLSLHACRLAYCAFFCSTLFALFSSSVAHAQGDASTALPAPGKALVFVFRKDRVPLPAPVSANVNSQKLGLLTNNTYVIAAINPGATKVLIGDLSPTRFDFIAAPNQRYFIRVDGVFGATIVRTEVQPASEQEGLRALGQSRLIGDMPQTSVAFAAPVAPIITPSSPGSRAVTSASPANSASMSTAPAKAANVAPRASTTTTQTLPNASTRGVAANSAAPATPSSSRPLVAETQTSSNVDLDTHRHFAISVSTGNFSLSNPNQTLAGLSSTYDASSKSVLNVQVEWRDTSGVALGGELFTYSNDIATTGSSPDAKQNTLVFMANAKYYFQPHPSLRPFVGTGLGLASATYSGNLAGSATGLAYQAILGAELRFNSVMLLLHYKFLVSTVGSPESVSIGGSGVLLGAGLAF